MKFLTAVAAVSVMAQGIAAFPAITSPLEPRAKQARKGCKTSKKCNTRMEISNKEIGVGKTPTALQKISAARSNCGAQGECLVFDAEKQFVSTTGQHAYASPKVNQIRGPCPGLNAAANHAYLPRSGVPTLLQTITGMNELYGMSADLSGFLAAYAIALDGDIISLAWSIGGPPPTNLPLLGPARGISYSHNKYEGDSSIGRCDAFMNGGDAHSLSLERFKYAYEAGMDNDRYTLDKFSQEFAKNALRSIRQNPYYFAPLFSTTLVSPAAYNFVINFMSNHSEEEPSGYLDGKQFKEWFAVTGKYPNFKWLPGQERIPDNWYRRTNTNQYTAASVFLDLIPEFLAYPSSFRFGGNTNGEDTYLGIDIANFTGSAYNLQNLFEGDNLSCFMYQTLQQALPDVIRGGSIGKALALVNKHMDNAFGGLGCSAAFKIDPATYDQYPGNSLDYEGEGMTC